jgi:hypothetical protein
MSRPSSPCSSVTTYQPDCSKSLEERLADAERSNLELKHENERLQDEMGELLTYCYHSSGNIVRLQKQLYSKETRECAPVDEKEVNAETRVPECPRYLKQRWEEDMSGWLHQNEELVRKVAKDQAQLKRRADLSCVFTGPLRETRRKQDLEEIAFALSLSFQGTKRDILERILKEFEANPELKTDPVQFAPPKTSPHEPASAMSLWLDHQHIKVDQTPIPLSLTSPPTLNLASGLQHTI